MKPWNPCNPLCRCMSVGDISTKLEENLSLKDFISKNVGIIPIIHHIEIRPVDFKVDIFKTKCVQNLVWFYFNKILRHPRHVLNFYKFRDYTLLSRAGNFFFHVLFIFNWIIFISFDFHKIHIHYSPNVCRKPTDPRVKNDL